jgi:hypothetical protein
MIEVKYNKGIFLDTKFQPDISNWKTTHKHMRSHYDEDTII